MDSDNEQTLNVDPESSTEIDLSTDTPAPSAEPEEVVEETQEQTPEEDVKPVEDDKRSAQARIRELNEAKKAAEQRAESLAEQMAKLTGGGQELPTYQPQQTPVNENGEIDPVAYKNQILQEAMTLNRIEAQRNAAITRINREAEEAIGKYDVLNPDKPEQYNEELSRSVTRAAIALAKQDMNADIKGFVEGLMSPYSKSIQKESANYQTEIAKQVTQKALRPTQTPTSEKKAEDMSLEELEAKLGVVQ